MPSLGVTKGRMLGVTVIVIGAGKKHKERTQKIRESKKHLHSYNKKRNNISIRAIQKIFYIFCIV